jgi:hypothetical protein
MATYRAYLIDKTGHITDPPCVFESDDDHAAMKHAQRYTNGYDVEVWDGDRAVAVIVSGGLKVQPRMRDAEAYLKLAEQCHLQATEVADADVKHQFEEMARGWLALAHRAEAREPK